VLCVRNSVCFFFVCFFLSCGLDPFFIIFFYYYFEAFISGVHLIGDLCFSHFFAFPNRASRLNERCVRLVRD